MIRYFGSAFVLTVLGFIVAYQFVDPAPPKQIKIAAGAPDGAYYRFAQAYRRELAAEGIQLEVLETAGSVDNLARLRNSENAVDIAFVQSGLAEPSTPEEEGETTLRGLGSLYFEPLWVFHHPAAELRSLADLQGKRVAVGAPGSGTRRVATALLTGNRVEAQLLPLAGGDAEKALGAGEVDAVFMIASARSPVVASLLRDPEVSVMSFERAEAYRRIHRYLSRVVLPRGVIDLRADVPANDVQLIAPSATLVATDRLHPALIGLMLQAAARVHGAGGLFEESGQFPSPEYVDFPLSEDARRFYKRGPPFLQRFLPFWAATLIDRMLVMLLPLVALLLPLIKVMPPVYQWRMRSRIYRWYGELLATDPRVTAIADHEASLRELDRIEEQVARVNVPPSFAGQLYLLRSHIELVRGKLKELAPVPADE